MEGSSKTKRGKSFTIEEDMAICKSWCNISEDPIVGMQSYAHFWGRIYENCCLLQNDQSRTQVSIQSRWGIIMKCSNKFRECLAQVKNLHPSGISQVDIMLQANCYTIKMKTNISLLNIVGQYCKTISVARCSSHEYGKVKDTYSVYP
ncbi:hypothetical protein CsSME_00040729 [Camellia sinensis var. sinensis]